MRTESVGHAVRALDAVIAVWIALLPFALWNGAYEPVKAYVWLAGGVLVSFRFMVTLSADTRAAALIDGRLWAWIAWTGIVGVLTNGPASAMSGSDFRHQGILFFFIFSLVMAWAADTGNRAVHALRTALPISVLIQSVIILLQFFLWDGWRSYAYKGPPGTLGEPNAAAAFLVSGLFFLPGTVRHPAYRTAIIASVTMSLAVLRSYTAWAMFFVWLVTVIPHGRTGWIRRNTLVLTVLAAVLIGAAVVSIPKPVTEMESRYWLWRMAVRTVSERPVTGYGPDAASGALTAMFDRSGHPLMGVVAERAHNILLDILLWSGIVGLGLFVNWLVRFVTRHSRHPYRMGAIASWLLYAMFHPVGAVHWLMIALVSVIP